MAETAHQSLPSTKPIPFIDLQAQRARIGTRIDAAIAKVLAHGGFIMGPEVMELERRLAKHSGAKFVLSCSSGTDALVIPLMAKGVGHGDAVFVPSFTFTATAEVVALAGATPIFIDVHPDTFNLDPASLARGILTARRLGLKPRAVIPVDLFGQPADMDKINALCAKEGIWVLADAAQSYGARYKNIRVGALAEVTATSFYPSKPLGAYGDGGAVFTDDEDLYHRMTHIRVHGQGKNRNENVCVGLTARLDTIQAAVLLEKLDIFDDECAARQRIAERYHQRLGGAVITPKVRTDRSSVWAQYTIKSKVRDKIVSLLGAEKIPTSVFYPKPIHVQPAYRAFPQAEGGLPVTEALSREVVSLPMHPYLSEADQDRIVAAVQRAAS
ncbi:MAG: DegT/DnrJ/EryC1/StrS family aminotransferase [Alphaproteobacteria bacterium]|nr:DegT/DnrJ/EryC1/StrS family aminotransferase [Alphaproteobacteria bacterium]PHY01497.1 MAG: aminotransferase DegT [Rhodospirillaceae bacterium]